MTPQKPWRGFPPFEVLTCNRLPQNAPLYKLSCKREPGSDTSSGVWCPNFGRCVLLGVYCVPTGGLPNRRIVVYSRAHTSQTAYHVTHKGNIEGAANRNTCSHEWQPAKKFFLPLPIMQLVAFVVCMRRRAAQRARGRRERLRLRLLRVRRLHHAPFPGLGGRQPGLGAALGQSASHSGREIPSANDLWDCTVFPANYDLRQAEVCLLTVFVPQYAETVKNASHFRPRTVNLLSQPMVLLASDCVGLSPIFRRR